MMDQQPKPAFDLKNAVAQNRLVGLWRMLTGYRLLFFGAMASLAVAAVARTSTFLLLQHLVDDVLGREGFLRTLWIFAAGFVGLAIVEGIGSFLRGALAARAAEGVTRRLRDYLYDHLQRLPYAYHDRTRTGELIQRVTSDVEAIRRFFAEQAVEIGRILSIFFFNLIALLSINVRLGLLSIVAMPVIIAISLWFFSKISIAYEAFQDQEGKLSATLQENLTGMRVVRAFNRQPYEREKFEADNWEKFLRGRHLLILHSFFWPVSDIICVSQTVLIYYLGAKAAIENSITIGDYLAISGLVLWIIWPMRNLGRVIVQASAALVSYRRVATLLAEEREDLSAGLIEPPDGQLKGELRFNNVCFEYDQGDHVLKDIALHVKPGQMVALLGPTGSGKSSLVNLLPRFYDYTGGNVQLDDHELADYPIDWLRRQIGIVEQEPFLFSRSIRENIAYGAGRQVSIKEIEDAARSAAIHDVILSFPKGYDTLVGEKGVTLSGGQKQRLAIARTLLRDPRILILDDSTSSVDSETESEIQAALEGLMKGRTSFVIAHRIQTIIKADQIVVMDKGRIVQQGTHQDLIHQDGLYRKIYQIQSRLEQDDMKENGNGRN
ncbi:MAG: ABC transporter ATP-binding protein [Anaerolineales bacterium]|nr:ABC transporter ATP-binding protein [Anaerolineales bacterium]